MRSPKEWQLTIDQQIGPEHPFYGMLSDLIGDWERHQEVWTGIINGLESRVDRDRAKLDAIQALLK